MLQIHPAGHQHPRCDPNREPRGHSTAHQSRLESERKSAGQRRQPVEHGGGVWPDCGGPCLDSGWGGSELPGEGWRYAPYDRRFPLPRRNRPGTLGPYGADKNAKNYAGATALDSVAGSFDEVKGIYDLLQAALGPVGLKLDYEQIKVTRPEIAKLLR